MLSTLKQDDTKVHFFENSYGETQVYEHVNYAIDTDRTYAILIGARDFEGSFTSIPPVQVNIEDLYHLLTDKLHIGLPKENVVIAYNKSNTEIEEILLKNSRHPDMETLLIYYAGHGHRTDVKKLYLIAHNTRKIDDYILGGIDFDFLNNVVLKSSSAKQKILILDACHSGIATQGDDNMVPEIDVKGTYILTSSPGDEVSYFDKNGRNTHFTSTLLDVLKNGVDNSNEMLALDDLYDHAHAQLQKKNFPHPITKNQLNIPPSQFFIARNPLFSVEKLKRRPSQLFNQGRSQDALYEYEILLQKYPDDLELRKEAEQCRSKVLFSQLVHDADELFWQHNKYQAALEKYRKALQIKPDDMVQNKISRCEERIRSGGVPMETPKVIPNISTPDPGQAQKTIPVQEKIANEKATPLLPPKPLRMEIKDKPTQQILIGDDVTINPIVLALTWLFLVIIITYISENTYWAWYLPSVPILIVTGILLVLRFALMGNSEFLLYVYAALPGIAMLALPLTKNDDTLFMALIACTIPSTFYLRVLKKRINTFNVVQLTFASVALIAVSLLTGLILFFTIGRTLFNAYNLNGYIIAGYIFGGIAGIGLSILMITKWLPESKAPL